MSEVLELTMEGESTTQYVESRGREFDAITAVARRKLGAGEDWEWYSWEVLPGDDVLVEGGVPSNPHATAGATRWRGVKGQRVVVTIGEIDAARLEHERTSGHCWKCNGRGEEWAGWNHQTGHRYRTCTRCAGGGTVGAVEQHQREAAEFAARVLERAAGNRNATATAPENTNAPRSGGASELLSTEGVTSV